jgi:hypothetical protein
MCFFFSAPLLLCAACEKSKSEARRSGQKGATRRQEVKQRWNVKSRALYNTKIIELGLISSLSRALAIACCSCIFM